jgi:cob(I)alamin adenosyltransferase
VPRITRIYTRRGDDGSTGLGGGQRVSKDSLRIEVFGTVDELSSQLGVVLSCNPDPELAGWLTTIQNELFHLGSDLCVLEEDKARMPVPRIEQRHVDALEGILDQLTAEVGPLENFVLPGGAPLASQLHVARTVCRRAERLAVALAREEPVGEHVVRYLNRLSDTLFVMARAANRRAGIDEPLWNSRA